MNDDTYSAPASDSIIGLPPADRLTDYSVFQGYGDTCAIRSQEIILRDFGVEVPQEELIAEATEHGWYQQGGGTQVENVGKLLELHGVGVERYSSATIDDLAKSLAEGKRVIVGVDSGELWGNDIADALMEDNHADHALIVAGIDTTDPLHVQVVLTDPGTGHVAQSYPMEQFMDSWRDSNNVMIVTEQPAPATAAGMANFDYEAGHLESIAGMDYDAWVEAHADNFSAPYYTSFDINGDGVIDSALHDFDEDGRPDLLSIVGENGSVLEVQEDAMALSADTDGDGQTDTTMAVENDGTTSIAVDIDGDGQFDAAVRVQDDGTGTIAVDVDGDGQLDLFDTTDLP